MTFNLTKALAIEGELNYFPSSGFDNNRRFQGQFGVKSGWRFKRFGVFGKVRPGFINTKFDIQPFCTPIFPSFCSSFIVSDTEFSLDVGGVAELYPSKRIVVRLDVGDTIANRQSPPIFINQTIFNGQRTIFSGQAPPILVSSGFFALPGPIVTTHNLQLSAGVGFRF